MNREERKSSRGVLIATLICASSLGALAAASNVSAETPRCEYLRKCCTGGGDKSKQCCSARLESKECGGPGPSDGGVPAPTKHPIKIDPQTRQKMEQQSTQSR